MNFISKTRARAGISGVTAALATFGLLSSPMGFNPVPRALAQPLAAIDLSHAPYPFTEVDTVLIDEEGYDVGGDGFSDGSPDEPALLTWTQAWFGSSSRLTGKFHFEGAERCARVKLISMTASNAQIAEDVSDTECPGDLGHSARVITESGNIGVTGRGGAAKVKVVLQTQNADLSWSNAGNQTVTYGPVLDTDSVQILSDYADLGRGVFDGTKPAEPATMTWNSDGTLVNPILSGATLYINNAHDLCFRTKVTYKKYDGVPLEPTPRTGTERCVTDDLLHTHPVQMGAFFDNEVADITYAIEMKGGTGVWEEVGQTTVELGDPSIFIPNTNPQTFP
jgi:hypothetical protein